MWSGPKLYAVPLDLGPMARVPMARLCSVSGRRATATAPEETS